MNMFVDPMECAQMIIEISLGKQCNPWAAADEMKALGIFPLRVLLPHEAEYLSRITIYRSSQWSDVIGRLYRHGEEAGHELTQLTLKELAKQAMN